MRGQGLIDYRNEPVRPSHTPECAWRIARREAMLFQPGRARSAAPRILPAQAPERSMDTDILVIGAGPAGLAVAATLTAQGTGRSVIEKAAQVGASWRAHYDRLHLHTVKEHSALPGMPFPAAHPRYVPRQRVVDYLDAYAARFGIAPRFGVEATRSFRPTAAVGDDDARRRSDPLARRRRHDRRQQRSVRAATSQARRLRRRHRAQPRLSQRGAVQGPARARRRHGQHRRRDRARPGRAGRRGRALGALAGQHRLPRRPRPADAEDDAPARAPADRTRRRARALALRRHGRRPRPLWPAPLGDLAALRAARARPYAGDRRRHAGADQGRRDRGLSGYPSSRRRVARSSSTAATRRSTRSSSRPAIARASPRCSRRALCRSTRTACPASRSDAALSPARTSSASTCASRDAANDRRARPASSPARSAPPRRARLRRGSGSRHVARAARRLTSRPRAGAFARRRHHDAGEAPMSAAMPPGSPRAVARRQPSDHSSSSASRACLPVLAQPRKGRVESDRDRHLRRRDETIVQILWGLR